MGTQATRPIGPILAKFLFYGWFFVYKLQAKNWKRSLYLFKEKTWKGFVEIFFLLIADLENEIWDFHVSLIGEAQTGIKQINYLEY